MKFSIKQVNDFSFDEYLEHFSNIIELCSKFARILYDKNPFGSTNDVILTLYEYLDNLENEEKRAMLTHYPDLTGKLKPQLTPQSRDAEKSVQLNSISEEERTILLELNTRYRRKFGFPFVVCVKENNYNYKTIIHILKMRLEYSQEEEIHNGIGEVKKISTLRILDLIEDNINEKETDL